MYVFAVFCLLALIGAHLGLRRFGNPPVGRPASPAAPDWDGIAASALPWLAHEPVFSEPAYSTPEPIAAMVAYAPTPMTCHHGEPISPACARCVEDFGLDARTTPAQEQPAPAPMPEEAAMSNTPRRTHRDDVRTANRELAARMRATGLNPSDPALWAAAKAGHVMPVRESVAQRYGVQPPAPVVQPDVRTPHLPSTEAEIAAAHRGMMRLLNLELAESAFAEIERAKTARVQVEHTIPAHTPAQEVPSWKRLRDERTASGLTVRGTKPRPVCKGATADGAACKRLARTGSRFCTSAHAQAYAIR